MTSLIACHECDLLNRETVIPPGGKACCRRCGALLYRRTRNSLDRTLAFTLGAAVLMVVANLFPIVELDAQGHRTSTTLFGSVRTLYDDEMRSVATLVFATTILMPALETGAMIYMLLPLKLGWVPKRLPAMFRLVKTVRPWSMAKLEHLAHVVPGVALWSFGALMVLMAAAAASFDAHELWARVEATGRRAPRFSMAASNGEAAR